MSHRPVHWRIARAVLANGRIWIVRLAASHRNPNVDRVEYVGYGRTSAPTSSSPRAVCET